MNKTFRTNENKTEGSFFCKKSKTCIQKSWTCDGHVNCIHGEDESFELCSQTYPGEFRFYFENNTENRITTLGYIINREDPITVFLLECSQKHNSRVPNNCLSSDI